MKPEEIARMKLTPDQKLQILREIENKLSVSFSLAIQFFANVLDKHIEDKKKEAQDIIKEVDDTVSKISYRELEAKDLLAQVESTVIRLSSKEENIIKNISSKQADVIKIIEDIANNLYSNKDSELKQSIDDFKILMASIVTTFEQKISSIKGIDGKDAKVDYNLIFDYINSQFTKPKDGSPDQPSDIVKKLNVTKSSIKPDVINGYQEEISNLKNRINILEKDKTKTPRKYGGGMGNWIHESTAISSLTTTVLLSYEPAAGGSAILVRYQGVLLAHGVQYTISGKVITLNFTPTDGTYLDVTYVRS